MSKKLRRLSGGPTGPGRGRVSVPRRRSSLLKSNSLVVAAARRLRVIVNPNPQVPVWVDSPVFAALLCLVPGLGHLYMGRVRRGLIILALALPAMYVAVEFVRMQPGAWGLSVWAMLAAFCVFDLVLRPAVEVDWRWYLAPTLLAVALWAGAYGALTPVAEQRRYFQVTLEMTHGPFESGTVLTFDRHAYGDSTPQFGDLVRTSDEAFDFVLGVPGDEVRWMEGVLSRNGEVQEMVRPLAFGGNPPNFEIEVPEGRYLVLPRAWGEAVHQDNGFRRYVAPVALVPAKNILYRFTGEVPEEWLTEPVLSRIDRGIHHATD